MLLDDIKAEGSDLKGKYSPSWHIGYVCAEEKVSKAEREGKRLPARHFKHQVNNQAHGHNRKIKPIVRHKFNLVICVDLNGPRMGTQGVDQRHGEKQQRECLGASTQSNTPHSQHGVNNQPEEDSTGPSKRHGADMMHNGNNREELTMLLDDIKTEGNHLKSAADKVLKAARKGQMNLGVHAMRRRSAHATVAMAEITTLAQSVQGWSALATIATAEFGRSILLFSVFQCIRHRRYDAQWVLAEGYFSHECRSSSNVRLRVGPPLPPLPQQNLEEQSSPIDVPMCIGGIQSGYTTCAVVTLSSFAAGPMWV
ncbi:uncharacterized protein F5891DRAFT_990937 [Suillus fuscotomentosus]|uniref:Uncharacterized protein n=1 Tax=Suillus fuscotomentosus TaxID=1912939 RepID=A0AAD4HBL2_9AGAM|nr:uncharacterized protein F5891DRAFT_990937 [Suillus fuscotomentosus]KAG1883200.1 hypothetical protein F5891DRAFT_990937 [Suillus fuscotomentosus]